MLWLTSCAFQPIQSLEPNVLSRNDDLVIVNLRAIDKSVLTTDTLIILPYSDPVEIAPELDSNALISNNAAALVRLGALPELPENAAAVVHANQVNAGFMPVGDMVPRRDLDLPLDSVAMIEIQPGIELPNTFSELSSKPIPIFVYLSSQLTEATLQPSVAVCRGCSRKFFYCIWFPRWCGL